MGRPANLKVNILGDAKGLGGAVDEANGRLGKLGGFAKKAGLAVGAGIAVGATALVGFAADSVRAASDLQQSAGAVESVFGSMADTVKGWAAGAASDVGLATSAYENLAVVTGAQLKNFGLSTEQAAAGSQKLITLGADLSATYGGDVSQAVEAVGSLLRGESDPIEKYGVSINQATIAAELHAKGLDKLTGAALTQAKAQATMDLLFKQTADSSGAFGRESDTLAHQQQVLSAQFENVKAKVGTALLPMLTALFSYVSTTLGPNLARLGSQLSTELGPAFAKVGNWITDNVLPAARYLYSYFITQLAPALRKTAQPIIEGIGEAFVSVGQSISDNKADLERLGKQFLALITYSQRNILPFLGPVLGAAFKVLGVAIGVAIAAAGPLADQLDAIANAAHRVESAIGAAKRAVGSGLGKLGNLVGFTAGPVTGMVSSLAYGTPGVGGMVTQLATAAAADPVGTAGYARAGSSTSSEPALYVDRRRVNIRIDGALDAPAVVRQLRQLLRDSDVRLGTAPSLGIA